MHQHDRDKGQRYTDHDVYPLQSSSDTVAAITKLENDSVKADLASDTAFADKVLADNWIGCNSDGKWYTKAEALKMVADTKNNKFNTEKLKDLKVRRLRQHCRRNLHGYIRRLGRGPTPRALDSCHRCRGEDGFRLEAS